MDGGVRKGNVKCGEIVLYGDGGRVARWVYVVGVVKLSRVDRH